MSPCVQLTKIQFKEAFMNYSGFDPRQNVTKPSIRFFCQFTL